MKTISIPTYNRPDYLRRTLESLEHADGIQDWHLVFSCEPAIDTARLISRIRFAKVHVSTNSFVRGCWVNCFLANETAYGLGSQLNIHLEDDMIVSRDALRLADQFVKAELPGILCLCRWTNSEDWAKPARVTKSDQGLLGNGFAWRREQWPVLVRSHWFNVSVDFPPMWDHAVDAGLRADGIEQWRPMVRRCSSIGIRGTHTAAGWDTNLFGPIFDGNSTAFDFVQ